MCWCICNAWLLPLCLPPCKEGICHTLRHWGVQLGGPRGIWVLLRLNSPGPDPIPKHTLVLLPSEPITKACHLPL